MALNLTVACYSYVIQSPFGLQMLFYHGLVTATKLFLTGVFSNFSPVSTTCELEPLEFSKPAKSEASRFFDFELEELRSIGFNASNSLAILRAVFYKKLSFPFVSKITI